MAEVLSAPASVIAVVGFAGQLAQSSALLYDFFKGFKNAPEDIQALSQELQVFTSILTNINQSPYQANAGLRQALGECEKVILKLSSAVRSIQPAQDTSKPRLWVKQFRATLKRSELAKHLRDLERAKSTLLQCCTSAMRYVNRNRGTIIRTVSLITCIYSVDQARGWQIMKAIETSLEHLAQEQTSCSTNITNLMRQVNSDTSALSATTADIALVTTGTHTLAERLTDETLRVQETSARIEKAAQDLVESAFVNQPVLLQEFQQTLRRTIKRSVRRNLQKAVGSKVEQQTHDDTVDGILPALDREDNQNSNPTRSSTTQHLPSGAGNLNSSTNQWIKSSTESKIIDLMRNPRLGTLVMMTTIVSYRRRGNHNAGVDERKARHTTMKYLPASWLSSTGIIARYTTWGGPQFYSDPTPLFSLRTVNIVPLLSEITTACLALDLSTIRRLFDAGLASPYHVNPCGLNLLVYVARGAYVRISKFSHSKLTNIADNLVNERERDNHQ